MNQTALEELREKAPLVDVDELSRMIETDLLGDDVRPKTDSVWLSGSFVNPHKEIDRDDGQSDLDLFVVVPEWDLPPAMTSIAIFASQPPTPPFFRNIAEQEEWARYGGRVWGCPADEAWERLPEYARNLLVRSMEKRFYRSERELERNRVRNYDVFMGNRRQIETQASKTNASVSCIWEQDGGRTTPAL